MVDSLLSIQTEHRIDWLSIHDVKKIFTPTKLISKMVEIPLNDHTLIQQCLGSFHLRQIT
jgi:hypothetical protein